MGAAEVKIESCSFLILLKTRVQLPAPTSARLQLPVTQLQGIQHSLLDSRAPATRLAHSHSSIYT